MVGIKGLGSGLLLVPKQMISSSSTSNDGLVGVDVDADADEEATFPD